MIIQSLCHHYDILEKDKDANIPKFGYSTAKVSFVLVISPDGMLSNIVPLMSGDIKPIPQNMEVPEQKSRSSNIFPYFVCDKAQYIFGVEKLKKEEFKRKFNPSESKGISSDYVVLEENDKEVILVHQRSKDCFEAFKAHQHNILDGLEDPEVRAFLAFLDGWSSENFLQNPKIREYKDDLLGGGNCVFACKDFNIQNTDEVKYLHNNINVKDAWEKSSLNKMEDKYLAQCLISGEIEQISRIHQNISGVRGAQSAGAFLVSFNDDSFYSYGKTQSYNSPISESAMFKYTTALNYLLASQRNKISIGDTTIVFWAETNEKSCEEIAKFFFYPQESTGSSKGEKADSQVPDISRMKQIEDILTKVRNGKKINQDDVGTDPESNFYLLGLAPNNARLAVRFWYVDHVGDFIQKVARHHIDMEIIRDQFGPRYVSIYGLLNESIPKKIDKTSSEKNKVFTLLADQVLRSILTSTAYPVPLYNSILNRVKVEGSINFIRAGFIKAYLLRLSRSGLTNIKEELITVSLNEESKNVPYRLGMLFAVLERAQSDTNREMKSTINSKYFSSASSTPAVVFPVLLKLVQHHIAKSDWGFKSNQMIEQILAEVDEFPAYLNLEEQGMFMLGYYHQRKAFFIKKNVVSSEED